MKLIIRKQSGFALLSALFISVIVLITMSVLVLKISSNTKDIVRRENLDKSLGLSEAAISHVLDQITALTYNSADPSLSGKLSAVELIEKFNTEDWMATGQNTKFSTGTGVQYSKSYGSNPYLNSFNSLVAHSTTVNNWYSAESHSSSETLGTSLVNAGATGIDSNFSLDSLHEQGYRVFHLKEGKLEADFKISIIPLRTDINDKSDVALHQENPVIQHIDVLKVRAIAYIPNQTNPKLTRTIDLIVNRSIKFKDANNYNFNHAILSGGDTDLGNKDTTSGITSTTLDAIQEGDVHANGNLIFGANGKVNGKATAGGEIQNLPGTSPTTTYDPTVTTDPRFSTTKVTNKSGTKSGVTPVTIPQFNTSGLPTNPCPSITDGAIFKDCVVNGNFSLSGNKTVEFQGTVYITGNLSQSGNTNLNITGNTAVRVVVGDGVTANTGSIDIAGGSNNANTREVLFLSRALPNTQAITVRGNPGTNGENGAVFAAVNNNTTSTLAGNIGFFGALITAGNVNAVGNSGSVQRDSDLSSLKQFLKPSFEKSGLMPKIISWKEVN